MPRNGKSGPGGSRQGAPGQMYQNRSDLNTNKQPVAAAPGQPYGARGAQEAAQRAIPLPATPSVPAPAAAPALGPAPGSLGAFDRPTEYPNEPLTAGLPVGPGAGPGAVRMGSAMTEDDKVLAQLRAVQQQYPSSDIARLIEYYDNGGTSTVSV